MGFYSIYKIFKDIFRTIFGSRGLRLILFVFVFLFIILFFNNGVFAATSLSNYHLTTEQEKILGASLYNLFQCYIDNGVITGNIEDINYVICIGDGRYASSPSLAEGKLIIFVAKPNGSITEDVGASGMVLTYGSSRGYAQFFYESVQTFDSVPTQWLESWDTTTRNVWVNSKYQIAYSNTGIGGSPSLSIAPLEVDPYIENQGSTISNWSFDYLTINSGSVGYVYYDEVLQETRYKDLELLYTYKGITYRMPLNSGFLSSWSSENFVLEIPRTSLLTNVNIENDESVSFALRVTGDYIAEQVYSLGSYTFSLSSSEQEQIQSDSDKAVQGQILETQQETNNKLDNLDNTINNSNVDFSSSDLPSDSTQDITADGVNGIFTSIYNAFCVGNAQDIVFPIPFTNKNITLSANYVSSSLTTAGAGFIIYHQKA